MPEQDIVTINDKQYDVAEMTERQKILLAHVRDLDHKIGKHQFSLDQMKVGRETFLHELTQEMQKPTGDSAT